MADEEDSSEKTWDKGPPIPPPIGEEDDVLASQACAMATEDGCIDARGEEKSDSSIELKSGVFPVYDDVAGNVTPPLLCHNGTNSATEENIVTQTGSPANGPNGDADLDDSGLSQGDPSQVNDSIMQDNMQDIEDRKANSPELGSDLSPDVGTDCYTERGSPSFGISSRTMVVERSVEATVSETERNGNLGRFSLGSSSRESLTGSCDSNANIKGVDNRTSMTRTLSDSQCSTPEGQVLSRCVSDNTNSDQCSPNRTENGDIFSEESPSPLGDTMRERLRSESEPPSQETLARIERRRKISRINPAISLSVQSINDAMSPASSPSHSPKLRPKSSPGTLLVISFIDRKVQEILDTESSYVKDLGDITEHYQLAMELNTELELSLADFNTLFGNLQAIHQFNKELLEELEKCNNDAVEIAECFLEKEREFRVYTDYCTNYPNAVQVLTNCTKNPTIREFFKKCQTGLGHALPLGAYLLKPVQRVLKYHLLFQDMQKEYNVNAEGYDVITDALDCMTYVARHINEMKRKHEAAVRVQEIQSQMIGLERDLNCYGDLIIEDVFRLHGARAERYLYLFEKVLLIGKKREDGLINVKTHISCSNLMLIDSIQKEPLGFNVIPFDNPTIQYTILARNQEQKKQWTHEVKRMILENYGSNIPNKVKELILKTTTPESGQAQPTDNDGNLVRDKKERRSRRKKRRNSEPMNKILRTVETPSAMTKLQRGQRQVKAALESFLPSSTRMKRPAIMTRRGSDMQTTEVLTDDSLDQNEDSRLAGKPQSLEDLSHVLRNSVSTSPLSRSASVRISERKYIGGSPRSLNRHSLELDSTLSEEDQESSSHEMMRSRPGSRSTKESNRDSGIGSMTLAEHLKQELDDRGSTEGDRADTFIEEPCRTAEPTVKIHHQKDDSLSKDEETEEDEEDPERVMKALDSPDELEALEILNETIDASIIDKGGTIDIDSLKAWSAAERGLSPMSPKSDEAFKLRYDIRKYKRMSSSSQGSQPEDDDIWVKMPPSRNRGPSPHYGGSRPLSAEVPTHPHFAKLPLARSSSETFKLVDDIHQCNLRAHSDPNILDTQSDKDSDTSSSRGDRARRLLDSSVSTSTLGASDEFSVSSTSSHEENLLDSVNSAFNRLGKKYALQSGSLATREEDVTNGNESSICSDHRPSRRDAIKKTSKKTKKTTHFTLGDADLRESKRSVHRTEASEDVSVAKVNKYKKKEPVPLPRNVHKLAREFSRRAKSLERPSTLLRHQSEPLMDSKGQIKIEEDTETDDNRLAMTTQPRGDLAKKVQSLQQALAQSQQKGSHNETTDLYHATAVLLSSESSNSDEDKSTVVIQAEPTVARQPSVRKKSVRDQVSQYECLSPKRSLEGKVVTPTSGMTVQQRLRTIQESCDNSRRSKSMDRSHFDERKTSPSASRTGSPLKSLRERKMELEDWLTKPVPHGRYKSEGAFLGMVYSDAMSNSSSHSDERDQVFSARSSRTSSVQSSESASPRLSRSSMSRRWSSNSSSLSEEDAMLFKSIKDRFRELEQAADKPVPRTCKDAREEIKAIAQAEKHFRDIDISDMEIDTAQQKPKQDGSLEDTLVSVDTSTAETDSSTVTQEIETSSVQIESYVQEKTITSDTAAETKISIELQQDDIICNKDADTESSLELQLDDIICDKDADTEVSLELQLGDIICDKDADTKVSLELQDVVPDVQDIYPETEPNTELQEDGNDAQDIIEEEQAADATSGDVDTLKRSQAEELMRQLTMLTLSNGASGTLKRSSSDPASNSLPPVDDQINLPSSSTDTKEILAIEEEPGSTSTQYSLDEDIIPIEHTHLMDHNYRSTTDDSFVPTRVTMRVSIDRETRSEGGLSPERKGFPLERILSSDSNIFMDAKSDLGGSEDSSSQSGFVTPVESFSQE